MSWFGKTGSISRSEMLELVRRAANEAKARICPHPKKVLLLPPDITRGHSGSGWIAEEFYKIFTAEGADVWVMPTLGQHLPHTPEENAWMFGSVPQNRIMVHDWRGKCYNPGEVPAEFVKEVSKGKADWAIPVCVNAALADRSWDLIVNIGHVVPHEVLGFANHNKNYFIGFGGKPMICASHMMAACCGIENNLGRLVTPLRACYNKAQEQFFKDIPDFFFEVVMAYDDKGELGHIGAFVGNDLDTYFDAAKLSMERNITIVPPLKKVVAVMQGNEFHSTWVANKAIYRTRMAMADGGELLIIAPGLCRFGEQKEVDGLIRQFGYCGTPKVLDAWKREPILQDLTHATAHLIHGSSEGRFKITYAPGHLTKAEIEQVCFGYADLEETLKRYDPAKLQNGFNTMPDGEEIYFISTPSAGLWSTKEKLERDE